MRSYDNYFNVNNYITHDSFFARKKNVLFVKDNKMMQTQLIHDDVLLIRPTYHGEINAFVLEIFATRDEMRPHWSYDFLEAAFDCFPHLEYCAISLPFSHPNYQFLQHFTVFVITITLTIKYVIRKKKKIVYYVFDRKQSHIQYSVYH